MSTTVTFGNPAPQMQVTREDGSNVSEPHPFLNQSVTSASMWDGFDDQSNVDNALSTSNDRILSMIGRSLSADYKKYSIGISELEQIVAVHTGGASPTWVDSSDPEFAKVLGMYFGCHVGEPTALFVTVGRDALHAQHMQVGAQPAAFGWMGLTASSTAPAASDTTLTGEIVTAGGGLIRAVTTYAHTAGTNTTTETKTFTANANDTLPVTLAQIGIFNALTGGTLGYHTALSSTATLSASGDNITVTWTDTAG
jgi:hypothetical protein